MRPRRSTLSGLLQAVSRSSLDTPVVERDGRDIEYRPSIGHELRDTGEAAALRVGHCGVHDQFTRR